MENRTARIAFIVVGAIAVVVGAVWMGQGANLIPGSFMTGDLLWFNIGLIAAVVGVVLVIAGLRRPKGGRPAR